MSEKNLVERVNEGGNLLANLALIDVNTWEGSVAVFNAEDYGTTNNMAIYRIVDGEVVFNLLGREGNLFVDTKFREDAYKGILENEFFMPQGDMKEHVMSAINNDRLVQVNYSGLNMKFDSCSDSYGYVEVSENNTAEEKKLINAVYETETPGNGKRIYLLIEKTVKEQLQNREDDLIARACYLSSYQNFVADDGNIDYCYCSVRGVRLEKVGEADANKIDYAGLARQLNGQHLDPVRLGQELDPVGATNLALSLANYTKQKQ